MRISGYLDSHSGKEVGVGDGGGRHGAQRGSWELLRQIWPSDTAENLNSDGINSDLEEEEEPQ